MTTPSPKRPQPLRDAVIDVSGFRGSLMGLITTLVSGGVIGASTGSLFAALLGLLPGVLALLSTFLGAHGVAVDGEPLVTPIIDPATTIEGQLVPLVPASSPSILRPSPEPPRPAPPR